MSKNGKAFWLSLVCTCIGVVALVAETCNLQAADRTMYLKAPCDPGGGGCGATEPPPDPPKVPGCQSVTASHECINNGRDCVSSLDQYYCCRLDSGECMTLIGDPTGESAPMASGILVRSASGPLLPGDFIFELEGEPIGSAESGVDLYECLKVGPRARVLRTVVDPWGNRYLTTVEVSVPRGFLFQRATWTPGEGFFLPQREHGRPHGGR